MGYVKCDSCGKDFVLDTSNPNIHYAPIENEKQLCNWCDNYQNLKDGEWYQTSDGKYHQKGKPKN